MVVVLYCAEVVSIKPNVETDNILELASFLTSYKEISVLSRSSMVSKFLIGGIKMEFSYRTQ